MRGTYKFISRYAGVRTVMRESQIHFNITCNLHLVLLPTALSPQGLETKILFAFLTSSIRFPCPVHMMHFPLIIVTMCGEE